MNERDLMNRLKRVIRENNLLDIAKFLVIDVNGGYELYGVYTVHPEHNRFRLSKIGTDTVEYFNILRHAVAWASLDIRKDYTGASRVLALDQLLEGATVDLTIHQNIYKKAKDVEKKLIYSAKIQEDKRKKQQITAELNTYINNAKNWQYRQFKEAVK